MKRSLQSRLYRFNAKSRAVIFYNIRWNSATNFGVNSELSIVDVFYFRIKTILTYICIFAHAVNILAVWGQMAHRIQYSFLYSLSVSYSVNFLFFILNSYVLSCIFTFSTRCIGSLFMLKYRHRLSLYFWIWGNHYCDLRLALALTLSIWWTLSINIASLYFAFALKNVKPFKQT